MACQRLLSSLSEHFDNPEVSDLVLEVEGRPIHVHRAYLRMVSPYYQAMLSPNWSTSEGSPNHHDVVVIKDEHSYETYRRYLMYLYTGAIEVLESRDGLVDLFSLAHLHDDRHLMQRLGELHLNLNTCCTLYHLARHFKVEDLARQVLYYVARQTMELVCTTEDFRQMESRFAKRLMMEVATMVKRAKKAKSDATDASSSSSASASASASASCNVATMPPFMISPAFQMLQSGFSLMPPVNYMNSLSLALVPPQPQWQLQSPYYVLSLNSNSSNSNHHHSNAQQQQQQAQPIPQQQRQQQQQ